MTSPTQVPVRRTPRAPARPATTVFRSLQREIDRLFEDLTPAFLANRGAEGVSCRMDLAETPGGLELTVELPGLDEGDFEVAVSDGQLTVSGEKKFEPEAAGERIYRLVERSYGAFSRSIELPEGVKAEDVEATLAKGVLKVVIPPPAKPSPGRVDIGAAA